MELENRKLADKMEEMSSQLEKLTSLLLDRNGKQPLDVAPEH